MGLSLHQQDAMPSRAAERLCHSLSSLTGSSTATGNQLSPAVYEKILCYCGVRPNLTGWRSFLRIFLTLLGFLSLVAGVIFFIAMNWAAMPKMAKFFLIQLFIIALAGVVWWRWYDAVARIALLAAGLSFGGLFALYGQVYQTGADSWELFRAWTLVLLPLALLGRQNALWFCTWAIANLAFQLYYLEQAALPVDDIIPSFLYWFPGIILYGYLAVQIMLLLVREALSDYMLKHCPESWLASRWCSRVMAAYLLLTLTPLVTESLWEDSLPGIIPFIFWGAVLAAGYGYYRYLRPDLYMLTLGVISLTVVLSCVLILQLGQSWDIDNLFIVGVLIALLLAASCALLLYWRRKMSVTQASRRIPSDQSVLLQALLEKQLLTDSQVTELEKFNTASRFPWYLHAVLALGGLVAGLITLALLILLLYATDLLNDLTGISLILPSFIIAVLSRLVLRTNGIGKHHIGLAWAIAATFGLCIGVYLLVEPIGFGNDIANTLWFLPVIAVMAVAIPNRLYRFMAVTALVFLLISSLASLISAWLPLQLASVIIVLLVAGIVALWLYVLAHQENNGTAAHRELVISLLYGIPTGLGMQSLANMQTGMLDTLYWIDSLSNRLPLLLGPGIALGLIASAIVHCLVVRTPVRLVYLPAAMVCGAIAIFAPGIGLGLVFLLVARYQGSKGLLVVAGCFLMWYLANWYYFLDFTLLHKSQLLFVSGLLLLCLAWVANQLLPSATGDIYAN